jgi:hypothetical protein
MLAERPEGSLRAEIETLAGQNDSIIETLAVVAGVPTTNFRSAPNSVDLQTFGQRLITMESNRARIDLANTWTAYQQLLGKTDGVAVPANYLGEQPTSFSSAILVNLGTTIDAFVDMSGATLTLQPGQWRIRAQLYLQFTTSAGATPTIDGLIGEVAIRTGSTTVALVAVAKASGNATYGFGSAPVDVTVNISAATTYKISTYLRTISGAVTASGVFARGDFFPTTLSAIRV